jgi:hypothetical protein
MGEISHLKRHRQVRREIRCGHSTETLKIAMAFPSLELLITWSFIRLTARIRASSEASSRSAGQEISHLLWSKKVHYRLCESIPLDPTLSQMNPVHKISHYFFQTGMPHMALLDVPCGRTQISTLYTICRPKYPNFNFFFFKCISNSYLCTAVLNFN